MVIGLVETYNSQYSFITFKAFSLGEIIFFVNNGINYNMYITLLLVIARVEFPNCHTSSFDAAPRTEGRLFLVCLAYRAWREGTSDHLF